jgi:hypothetical protein
MSTMEAILTEIDGDIIRQITFTTTTPEVWHNMVANVKDEPIRGAVMTTSGLSSDWLIPTPVIMRLRDAAIQAMEGLECSICGHDCISLGTEEGRDWWRCEECNWVVGRVAVVDKEAL